VVTFKYCETGYAFGDFTIIESVTNIYNDVIACHADNATYSVSNSHVAEVVSLLICRGVIDYHNVRFLINNKIYTFSDIGEMLPEWPNILNQDYKWICEITEYRIKNAKFIAGKGDEILV
jgi:hypothetical protein